MLGTAPCPFCGKAVPSSADDHVCHPADVARLEVEVFEPQFGQWLATPAGRFAVFYAERTRRRASGVSRAKLPGDPKDGG